MACQGKPCPRSTFLGSYGLQTQSWSFRVFPYSIQTLEFRLIYRVFFLTLNGCLALNTLCKQKAWFQRQATTGNRTFFSFHSFFLPPVWSEPTFVTLCLRTCQNEMMVIIVQSTSFGGSMEYSKVCFTRNAGRVRVFYYDRRLGRWPHTHTHVLGARLILRTEDYSEDLRKTNSIPFC